MAIGESIFDVVYLLFALFTFIKITNEKKMLL